jgi:hypothetical protein
LQVSLLELRSRALLRADMATSDFRDSALGGEVDAILNAEYRRAYRAQSNADDDLNITSQDYTTTTDDTYALPADFFRERKVEAFVSSLTNPSFKLRKFRLDELTTYSWSTGPAGFRLRGSNLIISPAPTAGITLRLWYTPAPELLTSDSQTIDCVTGLDELIVLGTAAALLTEEGDLEAAAVLEQKYAALMQEFLADIQGRAEPEQAADVLGMWDDGGIL